jgi:pimeloyl-ACP methyl ester carboxylesterase
MRLVANGIAIEIDDRGPPGGEPVLLIMGLGMQLVGWPEPFVRALASRGLRVIRIDNRDAGLSEDLSRLGVPNIAWQGMRHALHLPVRAPYGLEAMADDAIGVLDALGIASAHWVGASMGGMIAQRAALDAPRRVRSLSLIMTTPGARGLPGPASRVRAGLLARPPRVRLLPPDAAGAHRPHPDDLSALIEHLVRLWRLIGSLGHGVTEAELRERVCAAAARAWRPEGTLRQLAAIMAAPDRTSALRGCTLPASVIHGTDDPLLPLAHGRALAAALPGAQLHEMAGMGHDLPPDLHERLAELVAESVDRARARTP